MKFYNRCVFIVSLAFLLAACIRPSSSPAVGLRAIEIATPGRETPISVSLWYPTNAGGSPTVVGGNQVFKGVPVQQDAVMAAGKFPLILLAHGGLRSAPNLSGWIAAHLARRGFMVAEPHPPQLGPKDAQAALAEVWLRPADLSATLQAIESDAALNTHLQKDNIGVVGFGLGGTSVLTLAGAEIDPARYATMCDGEAVIGMDCPWFAANGVDLHEVAIQHVDHIHANRRIQVVIAIDPELSAVFTPASLDKIAIPVTIINLGTPAALLPALDAAGLTGLIPDVTYATVPDAMPYSAFSECTAQGASILQAEGDNAALCSDGGERSRLEIHRQLAEMIERTFVQNLSDH